MKPSSRSVFVLLAGIVLLAATGVANALLIDGRFVVAALGIAGLVLTAWGAYQLRADLGLLIRQRRGEIALYTLGSVGVLVMLAYLSTRFPFRVDMTENKVFSLSPATVTMLERLDKPVHIVFFHDRMMRETAEIYEQMARKTDKITVEFY